MTEIDVSVKEFHGKIGRLLLFLQTIILGIFDFVGRLAVYLFVATVTFMLLSIALLWFIHENDIMVNLSVVPLDGWLSIVPLQ